MTVLLVALAFFFTVLAAVLACPAPRQPPTTKGLLMETTTTPPDVRAEATSVAGAYLQILDPDQGMSADALDAFHVGVQAGITAALDVAQRTRMGVPR